MRNLVYLAVIILSAALGASLVGHFGWDDFGQRWVGFHLEIIQEQLVGLKSHLLTYRKAHGRYPTNDEGLAALDNFQARFTADFYRHREEPPGGLGSFYWPYYDDSWWRFSRMAILGFRERYGRVPQDSEEFRQALKRIVLDEAPDIEEYEAVPVELAIGERGNIFLLSPAGVLSPWLLPYVYENRSGLDASMFKGSPADADRKGRYSVRVDDGVFIYCIGGQVLAKKLDRMWWRDNGPRFVGGGLLLVAIVFVVVMIRSGRASAKVAVTAILVSAGAGGLLGTGTLTTCYVMGSLFHVREPEMIVQQRELLDKYHRRGVINDETYQKAVSAVDRGLEAKPAVSPQEEE